MIEKYEIGYKLFERDKRDRKLYPLFIGKTEETKVGEWIHAEFIPTKGYAQRGGWHIGIIPSAPHLIGASGTYTSRRGKNFERVWCVVSYNTTIGYTNYVKKLPKNCITDGIPENGYYNFKEPNGALWVISSDIKIEKVLTEEERCDILKVYGFDEQKAIAKRVEILNRRK